MASNQVWYQQLVAAQRGQQPPSPAVAVLAWRWRVARIKRGLAYDG